MNKSAGHKDCVLRANILRAMSKTQPKTKQQISEDSGVPEHTLTKLLPGLILDGAIEKSDYRHYRIPQNDFMRSLLCGKRFGHLGEV